MHNDPESGKRLTKKEKLHLKDREKRQIEVRNSHDEDY